MNLSEKQLRVITKTVADSYREHEQEKEQNKQDRRLRNIKLLLKNYRGLALHCEDIKMDLVKFEETSILDLDLDSINLESVESIKKSKKKSIAMMLFIKGKMDAYKHLCSADELKYFRILEMKYLSKKKYTTKEIAEFENIDERTVRRYLEKAISDLPVIFFGIDAICFK